MTNRIRCLVSALAMGLGLLVACGDDNEAGGEHDGPESSSEHVGVESSGEPGSSDGEHGASSEGGSAYAPATYLTTSGISRGVFSGPAVQADDYYADKLNDLEFALSYDRSSGLFRGRVKNEAGEGLCDARIKIIFDGNQTNSQSLVIPSLEVRERATFTLTPDTGSFTTWTAQTETFTCTDTPVHGSEGGGEGEGGHEGGGEGEGGGEDGGEDEGPAVPIDQRSVATINRLDLNIVYDQTTKAFTGVLTNNTSEPICGARLEIHVNRGKSTLELGPTVDADWASGQSRDVVLGFDPMPGDTFSLHPETGLCSGEHGADEPSGEHGADEPSGEHGGVEPSGEHGGVEPSGEHGGVEPSGEHDGSDVEGDAGTGDAEGGEESNTRYTKTDSYDENRKGVRLLLRYDPDQDAFVGTVTNTASAVLDQVRIEVHLSNGIELGPTTPGELQPGDSRAISLSAGGEQFETWSAHAEVGRDEHAGEGDEATHS